MLVTWGWVPAAPPPRGPYLGYATELATGSAHSNLSLNSFMNARTTSKLLWMTRKLVLTMLSLLRSAISANTCRKL